MFNNIILTIFFSLAVSNMLLNALKKSGYRLRYFTIKHHVFLLITEPPNLCN